MTNQELDQMIADDDAALEARCNEVYKLTQLLDTGKHRASIYDSAKKKEVVWFQPLQTKEAARECSVILHTDYICAEIWNKSGREADKIRGLS